MNWLHLVSVIISHGLLASSAPVEQSHTTLETEIWDELQSRSNTQTWKGSLLLRVLAGDYHVNLDSLSSSTNATDIVTAVEYSIQTLRDRSTIRDGALELNKDIQLPSKDDLLSILRSNELSPLCASENRREEGHAGMEDKVFSAIVRTLNFYKSQLGKIHTGEAALGLMILKEIDNKHGKVFQQQFPLDDWIQQNCEQVGKQSAERGEFCKSLTLQWKNRYGVRKPAPGGYWKSASTLQQLVYQMTEEDLSNIGNEKEVVWGPLNRQCQGALVTGCEVPYVCQRTFLDPTPRSQYMLSHQLLYRMLIDTADCPSTKSFVTKEETYDKFCAKMDMEAKYIDLLDTPIHLRDLFAEHVGFCGLMGYSSVLREDWLNKILSWQSKSDNGCFVRDPLTPVGLFSTDIPIKRQATKMEVELRMEPSERCLPHFTAVSLVALSAHWDYLKDNC